MDIKGIGILTNADVYTKTGEFVKKNLYFNKGKIVSKEQFNKIPARIQALEIIDMEDKFITPAIIDQHIHGGYGIDFNNAGENEIRKFLRKIKEWGHGGILATLVPGTIEKLNKQMDIIREIINNPGRNETEILGINLEGPFFNPLKAGIHPPEILMKPTIDNLKQLNLDNVKMITIAPELDEGYKATEYLNSMGIVTSAGHSVASAEQVRESKVKQVTHLFNAMSGFHHRIPTIANEGLMNDNLYAEVNSAIELLDPKTVDLIMKAKPEDKIILISDALNGTNIEGNSFIMGGKEIIIDENGIAKDKEGILAGSIKLLGQVAKRLIETTQMTFEQFIKFASINPAKNLGVNPFENLTIWNKETLIPEKTFIKGE